MSRKYAVVAVIDDHAGILNAMQRLLSTYGFDTELYSSGQAFLDAAGQSDAICLIVDINLGESCGIELARRLSDRGYKFPIVFMTANESEEVKIKALAIGGLALLPKPFTPTDLIRVLCRVRNC